MKFIVRKISVLSITASLLMTMSCIGDLDVAPIDPLEMTTETVYTDTESYKQGLAKLYAAFALTGQEGPAGQGDVDGVDEGFSCFIRSLWNLNELTTDEAVWTYPNDANGTIFNLHYNTWVPTDGIPTALFARIMNVAAITNEFIRVTSGKLDDPDIKKFHMEARFLRALAYYYGIDLFGNMPFVTEADLPGAFFPPVKTRAELYAFVESELLAIKPDMLEARANFPSNYGRADKGACAMLLAKLYLNAKVYIGQDKYTEAITQLNEVIAAPYQLSPKYLNNFLADNHTSPEIIFGQLYDGVHSQAYDGVNVMIYGNSGNGGWSGLRTTSAFVNKFTNPNEARALFAKEDKGQSLAIDEVNQSKQGYGVFKFRNVTSTGANGSHASFQDTDFPMFRLADAYLMYAEAVLRGGTGGSLATALGYVNAVRTRPGDGASAPGPILIGDLTLDFVLDERARELYWEGHRRTDLIRFGKFTGDTYLWPWKGGTKDGASIAAYRAIFPIPSADLATNPNLKQNTGY